MTGSIMVLLGSNGLPGAIASPSVNITNTSTATGIRSGSFTLVTDGTITKVNGAGSTSWFTPTTTGVGSLIWVKLTTSGASNTTVGGTTGSWIQISSNVTWSFQNDTTTHEGTGSFALSFATDSAGNNIVGSGSGGWDVGYTP